MPPFSSLLKSKEVEDPVNVYVHRPLAYGFVRLIYRTSLTPNQVTLLAMLVGVTAGAMWLWGTPFGMVAGGVLLWASGILDGADGILARAKNQGSEFGRALDGSADAVVAVCTVLPGFAHLYMQQRDPVLVLLAVPAIGLALFHIYIYDFYKELYLRMTRLEKGGEGMLVEDIERRCRELEEEGASLLVRVVYKTLLDMQRVQRAFVRITNPGALHERYRFRPTAETARVFREHNLGPMRLWAIISLCPHTYIMAICGMADRLDVYLWIRLFLMNAVFFAVLVWQRRATQKTLEELREIGVVEPVGAAQVA